MAKLIKSRFKICFQTLNKVWIYKNSRLRNFYNIRNKQVLFQGLTAKKLIITKGMKWTVIRRKMVPYIRTTERLRYNYKNLFFNKQQLKNFYGGLNEYKLRNIFKKTWNVALFYRRNIFIGALEQRLNMVLFRMRLVPTIFISTQFIMHKGIFVDSKLITLPSYRVKLGEVISIPENQWSIFYDYLEDRLFNRYIGESLLYWRKEFILKKLQYFRQKYKKIYIKNLNLLKNLRNLKEKFLSFKDDIKNLININQNLNFNSNSLKFLKIFYILVQKNLYLNILHVNNIIQSVRKLRDKKYKKRMHTLFYILYFVEYKFKEYHNIFLIFLINNKVNNIKLTLNNIKKNPKILSKLTRKLNIIENNVITKQTLTPLDYEINTLCEKIYLHWNNTFKKTLRFKLSVVKYNKYLLFLLRKLKYKKNKNKTFKTWCINTQWFTPNYLEIDYTTLRGMFIYYPEAHEVFYGFTCSFNKIISFYKERSL